MIVVTGGSGYIGSHIVWKLVEAGEQVRVMVHNAERARQEGRLAALPVEWVQGDVTRPKTLAAVMQDADAVIHTVAIAIEKGGHNYEEINYGGTVNVVDAAKAAGVARILNMSQLGADSRLPYRFLASKGKAQEYVARSGLDWTVVRGPRLTDDPGLGRYRVGWVGVDASTKISRDDLADFIVTQLDDQRFIRRMPFVSH